MLVLGLAYICIKNNVCWCHTVTKERNDSDDFVTGLSLLYDSDDRSDRPGKQYDNSLGLPYDKVLVREQSDVAEYNYVLTHPSSQLDMPLTSSRPSPYMSVMAKRKAAGVLGGLPSSSALSVTSSVNQSVDSPLNSDEELIKSDSFPVKKRKHVTLAGWSDPSDHTSHTSESEKTSSVASSGKKKAEGYIEDVHIKVSLHFSKADSTLLLTINEITGMPIKTRGGYNQIRVSTTLMPDKKKRTKTVWHQVTDDNLVVFGDSFKFVQMNRQILISSSFRFRLYGRRNTTRDICVGEVFVSLTEILKQNAGFVTWKTFQRRNSEEK